MRAMDVYQAYSSSLIDQRLVYIKHTKTTAGYGVYSDATIPKDSLLFFYEGETLRSEEVRRRIQLQVREMNYILTINETSMISPNVTFKLHFDAKFHGNVGRFVNHSCAPNCILVVLRTDSILGFAAFVTRQVIHRGEQLTFDYGDGDRSDAGQDDLYVTRNVDSVNETRNCNNDSSSASLNNRKKRKKPAFNDNGGDEDDITHTSTSTSPTRVKCLCRSVYCRGFLPSFIDN